MLLNLERQVDVLRQRARYCFARGWYRHAANLTERVVSLEVCEEDLRMLACAHLFKGDFSAAARVYARVRGTIAG